MICKNVSRHCCKLARYAFFGEDVMRACTPLGMRDRPGLPRADMAKLKETMISQFPIYQRSPIDFEGVWEKCINALKQVINFDIINFCSYCYSILLFILWYLLYI